MTDNKRLCGRWIFVLMALAFLLLSAPAAFSNDIEMTEKKWMAFAENAADSAPVMDVRARREAGMNIELSFLGYHMGSVQLGEKIYDRITFPGQSFFDGIGAPNIPVMRHMIGIPKGAMVKIAVTDVQYETYDNMMIDPTQRLLLETEEKRDLAVDYSDILYEADDFFPGDWAALTKESFISSVKTGTLEIYPVQFNPKTGKVRAAKKMTVSVVFEGMREGEAVYEISPHMDATYEATLLNYDLMDIQRVISEDRKNCVNYLVISNADFVNSPSLNSLIEYHKGSGLNVRVADVSTIGSDADKIKAYIQSEYDSVSPKALDYVLLVGDIDVIPMVKVGSYNSDMAYGWLAGTDHIGDVGVGRFPVRSEAELNTVVEKTLTFHKKSEGGAWLDKALLIAHGQNYPKKYTACKQQIFNHDYKISDPVMDRMFGGDIKADWTNNDILAAINEGRVVVNYRGHGGWAEWRPWNIQETAFTVEHALQLKNGKKTPVIFSIACTNADMTESERCLGETFLLHEAGAVAFLGASTTSSTSVNHVFDKALFNGTWDHGIPSIGALLNYANLKVDKTYGKKASKNIIIYLWMGDPALQIRGKAKVTVASDGFESKNFKGGKGWNDCWTKKGDLLIVKKNPQEGKFYLRMREHTGYIERSVDLSAVTSATLKFASRIKSFEKDDKALVKISSDGVSYTTVKEMTAQTSNNVWETIEINLSAYTLTKDFRIAFDADMNRKKDFWYLDNIEVVCTK